MLLKKITLHGFKSFAQKSELVFDVPVTAIVGPNGSGKSNVVEALRFVLGEQSSKSLRSKTGADLIFAGSQKIAKMSRASVTIVFDNTERVFQLTNQKNEKLHVDFDEIVLTREVYADGSSVYMINGQDVRLKDIHELIASVHIGSSGHHIISQGEADRLLHAHPRERREMIEEALGLKLYHFRIKEAERKLEQTEKNLLQSESLRREIVPHLRYLEREVKKINEAEIARHELRDAWQIYSGKFQLFLQNKEHDITKRRADILAQQKTLEQALAETARRQGVHETSREEHTLREHEESLRKISRTKAEYGRILGRLEGMIEMTQSYESADNVMPQTIALDQVTTWLQSCDTVLDEILTLPDIHHIYEKIRHIKTMIHDFYHVPEQTGQQQVREEKIAQLQKEITETQALMQALLTEELHHEQAVQLLREQVREQAMLRQEGEREYFEMQHTLQNLQHQASLVDVQYDEYHYLKSQYEQQHQEINQLVFEPIVVTRAETCPVDWDYHTELRALERLKMKVETMGGGSGADTLQEYEATKERETFLSQEINDLNTSMQSLRDLVRQLEDALAQEFLGGIKKINTQFQEFFAVLFGGGTAKLHVVAITRRRKSEEHQSTETEEESAETGIDIDVSLPKKKVKDIDMLSGGERSLTSIALLFALSQVNPPPFLVLDETDAALDEANSARYGDMIQKLSSYSQLIVVTHNRETMSRAQTLYGVTMGAMECSQLLSVRLEDAAQWAK